MEAQTPMHMFLKEGLDTFPLYRCIEENWTSLAEQFYVFYFCDSYYRV